MSLLYEASENGRMSGETLGVFMAVYLSNWGNYTRAGSDLLAIACPAPMPTKWRRGGCITSFENQLLGCENNALRGYSEEQRRWMISYQLCSSDPRLWGWTELELPLRSDAMRAIRKDEVSDPMSGVLKTLTNVVEPLDFATMSVG